MSIDRLVITMANEDAYKRAVEAHRYACRPLFEKSLLTERERLEIEEKIKGKGRRPGFGSRSGPGRQMP